MCSEATPWVNGARLPDHAALQTYRVMAPMAYAKIKNIIERNVTSGLIYLPSSARDLNNPQIDQYRRNTYVALTEWTMLNVSKFLN